MQRDAFGKSLLARKRSARSPGIRTGGAPGFTGAVRQASASQPVSRTNASRPPNAAGSMSCTNTDAPQQRSPSARP